MTGGRKKSKKHKRGTDRNERTFRNKKTSHDSFKHRDSRTKKKTAKVRKKGRGSNGAVGKIIQ